jgi:hypothetical protein
MPGCSPTTPGGYPDVRGAYRSPQLWASEFSHPDGRVFSAVRCGGNIFIDQQQDAALRGRYTVLFPCVAAQGELVGEVDQQGGITLDFRSPSAFATFERCSYVSGDRVFTGNIRGDDLEARIKATIDCPPEGTLVATRTVAGRLDSTSR